MNISYICNNYKIEFKIVLKIIILFNTILNSIYKNKKSNKYNLFIQYLIYLNSTYINKNNYLFQDFIVEKNINNPIFTEEKYKIFYNNFLVNINKNTMNIFNYICNFLLLIMIPLNDMDLQIEPLNIEIDTFINKIIVELNKQVYS